MRRIISFTLTLLLLALVQGVCQERKASPDEKSDNSRPISAAGKDAVVQAIVDEIYANNLQGYGFDVGKQVSSSAYQLGAYFKPTLNKDNSGWVIYKLMPYGQVLRMFTIRSDGMAVLFGKLRDHFPPTQPSYLTVYMDDDDLCQMERDWGKGHLTVQLKPSAERLAQARARQKKRE